MYLFKELLIESKGVTGRFCNSIADARGTGVLAEGRRIKTRRRFGWRLLCDSDEPNQQGSPDA